jgi:hypothetical protein
LKGGLSQAHDNPAAGPSSDAGQEVVNLPDLTKARRVGTEPKRVNVDFPAWRVDSLDREARWLGVTRQSLTKLWLADRLAPPALAGKR